MHGDIFYPTALLRLLLPTDIGMTWGFIIHIFLCGCFTYGFLRAWGLGFFPSLIGGIAYMLSGNVAGLVSPGHDGKLFVSALMPLALWFLLRGVRDDKLWAWGGLAITVGLAVLSPHPQLLQYMLLTCGAFGAFLAFGTQRDGTRLPRNVAITRLALCARQRRHRLRHWRRAVSPRHGVHPFLTALGRKGLRVRHQLLAANRGAVQHLPSAVQRHSRPLLGPQRHPSA